MAMTTLPQVLAFIRLQIPQAELINTPININININNIDKGIFPILPILRVHTDTRTLRAGDLFVALKGERFDANSVDFLAQAHKAGAVAALAHGGLAAAGLPGIEVPDTLAALGALAAGWRGQFTLPLIGVTGSNGKTTVTQMIAAILSACVGEAAFSTQGNLNNAIGVPQTLLRLTTAHRIGVVELGMNHPGEIALLAAMAQPTVALVNNAQREHLEFMHTVQAVAEENGSVLAALPADGVAVFPAGDVYTPLWRSLAGTHRCITFAAEANETAEAAEATETADVKATRADWCSAAGAWQVQITTPQGAFACALHIAGRHNVGNALAAAACALAAGVPLEAIARGLSAFVPVKGRSRALSVAVGKRTITVVDDSYNANPDSVRAAINVLAALPGPRLLVLGDMGEVGNQGPEFHAEAGAYARAAGIEQLFALGAQSTHAVAAFDSGNARHFDNMALLQAAVREALPTVGSVLVKGSRFMKMEQVLEDMVDTINTVNTINTINTIDTVNTVNTVNRVSPTVQEASCNALGAPC